MKRASSQWLESAEMDLGSIDHISRREGFIPVAAFRSQQFYHFARSLYELFEDTGMSALVSEALAKQVRLDEDTMWVDPADGRTLGVPLAYFPRLLNATPSERMKYVVSGGGTGLHWDDLDEDISVPALLLGVGDRTRKSAS